MSSINTIEIINFLGEDHHVVMLSDFQRAMSLLAEVEPHLDEWNFPLTLKDRVTEMLYDYFGDVRPELGSDKTGEVG